MKIFLVGGAVRDGLLGRPVRERDWVVSGATPDEMERRGYRAKAPGFPVYLHPESGEEYALARRETKSGFGYKGFTFDCSPDVSIEEDLARRDLTINAIAISEGGRTIDPYYGRNDVKARCLRHVTGAFVEDPLRVLRLVRFQAELGEFGFTMFEATRSLAEQVCRSGELCTLSSGRIWRETERALESTMPDQYFRQLLAWNALTQLMPWLQREAGQDLSGPIAALKRACDQCENTDVRLATLLAGISQSLRALIDMPANWPIPASARTLTTLCIDHPLPEITDPESTFLWLESVDAWRRVERFDCLLQVWLALRPDLSKSIDRLSQCRNLSRKVPKPAPDADPRDSVRAYRLQQISCALQ